MAVAREPEGDEIAEDPMINTADRFAKGDETARDPMINRDGRFVKGDEIDRGVRGSILYGMVCLQDFDGTKIMKIILHNRGHLAVRRNPQSGRRAG